MLSNSTNDFSSLKIAEKTNKAEENAFPSLECQAKGSKQGMLQIVITIYTSYSIFLPWERARFKQNLTVTILIVLLILIL